MELTVGGSTRGVVIEKLATFDRNEYFSSEAVYEVKVNIDESGNFDLEAHPVSVPNSRLKWIEYPLVSAGNRETA